MSNPVFICPQVLLQGRLTALRDAATVGAVLALEKEEAFHAQKVMRLRVGEKLDLVDREGLRVLATVEVAQAGALEVVVEGARQSPPPIPRLILVQALAKGGRDEAAIEMATEVGVDQVIPWQAQRSVVRWDGKKATAGVLRWQRVLDAGAKQARRAWVPTVQPLVSSAELAGKMAGVGGEGALVLIAHETGMEDYSQVVANLPVALEALPSITVVVGPEGGITEQELELFRGAGATVMRMGTNVMRSSTAGPAALVALNVTMKRW